MKKSLLSLVIASALPLSALADVTVYGKANVSLQNADEAEESALELVSNASRIGLKGGESINDDWKVIYQFEYQTEVDDGAASNGQTFAQRNIYVGLQGTGGTIIGGHFDTPVKAAQEKVDLFNDLEGDIAYLVFGETRSKNIVQYTTPTFGEAFAANFAYVTIEDPELDDGVSASLTYTTPSFYAALAYEQDVTAQTTDIMRAVARYTLNAFQFGAIYETAENDVADLDSDAVIVSVKYNATDDLAFKAQYGDASNEYLVPNPVPATWYENERDAISLGVDYLLSKNTTVFAYYTQENLDRVVDPVNPLIDLEADDSWLGVGIDFKF